MKSQDRIMVRSIKFDEPPFRKLSDLEISFASRMTLIAGHNGIGKSTILGLVSNTFGLTGRDSPRSYFGDHFFANIEKIVYLDIEEVDLAQSQQSAPPIVSALVGDMLVRKRCAMTKRVKERRARVVPRTVDRAEDDTVGPDAKIPLPTIYLGIRRLASIGEADDRDVASSVLEMHADDLQVMLDFVQSTILGARLTADMTQQSIKGAGKRTAHPGYEAHKALAVSMGQDSLGSIATALASFNRLKREQGAHYQGGLLVIDELDVGFHPHAIERLAGNLKTYASRLDLQIIATTHSPRLIETVHPEGGGNPLSPDSVIYLVDTLRPRIAEDQSLIAILNDMALRSELPVKAIKPVLRVYFEDAEGKQLFDALIPTAKRSALGRKYGVTIKAIGLGVGGSNLIKLPDQDPIFKSRVLIVDADTKVTQKASKRGNTIKFPCTAGATGTNRSPENMIKNFLQAMMVARDGEFRQALLKLNTPNPSSDKISVTFFSDGQGSSSKRDSTKSWWEKHWKHLKSWRVLELWVQCNPREAAAFEEAFERALASTATKLR